MTPTYPGRTLAVEAPRTPIGLRGIYGIEPILAVVAMVALFPLAIVIAVTIVILSRRGPLVRHARAGWHGADLPMLKFRTMWGDGGKPGNLFAIEDVSGAVPVSKTSGDARVRSRFAAFCRRYSLDELPQLYHVARGEMSLVGPRPITVTELEDYYGASAQEVLSVRPGLTGLWQILGRNRLNYARRKRLDLWYVRRASAGLYLQILWRSFACVFSGRDAY